MNSYDYLLIYKIFLDLSLFLLQCVKKKKHIITAIILQFWEAEEILRLSLDDINKLFSRFKNVPRVQHLLLLKKRTRKELGQTSLSSIFF